MFIPVNLPLIIPENCPPLPEASPVSAKSNGFQLAGLFMPVDKTL
jgi:hypothetical protein